MLNPIYYFKVNLLKPEVIFANYPDSNLDNIKNQLINSTIWVEGVPYPLKHGDVFTLSGMQALKVKELYIDSNQTPILDIVDIPNVENLTIGFAGEQVGLEWSSNNNFYTQIDIRFDEGNWSFAQKIEKGVGATLFAPLTETAILQVRLKFVDDQGNSSRSYIYESIEICSGHQCDVNDAPTDIALSASTIAENNTIGDVIGTLSTTDPDAGNSFTYLLVSGTGDTNNASFTIDGASLKANAVFNFEVKSSYTVRIRSTDQGGLTTEKAFAISVTDVNEAPTDIALSDSTIAENNEIGAVVGTLSTTDPDAGDTFTYSLISGEGDADNASFAISGSDLISNEVFDYEAKSSYAVRIRSTDQGSLTTEKAFTITVTNVNETPTNLTLSANTIAENNEIGAVIGTFTTTDPDAENTFTYTLIETAGGSELDNASFSISGSDLIANVVFDYEVKSTYYIHVRSTDQGGLYGGDVPGSPPFPDIGWTFTITVTDVSENQAPTDISLSSETIAENNEIGAVVGTLSTTDPDAGDTFTYTLASGTGDTDNASFTIDGADLIANEVFDYEAKSSYAVRIRSTDQGSLTTERSFTITVTNVNEQPTYVTLSSDTIAENNEIGAVIGTFSTTDQDAGDTFTYTLTETINGTELDNASFSIDGANLIANVVFDYEVKSTYYIHVRSTDQDGLWTGLDTSLPPWPNDWGWRFTITVTDASENSAPTDITISSETIPLNNASGAVIGALSTTDPDAGDTFTYTLVSGEGSGDNFDFSIAGSNVIAQTANMSEMKGYWFIRVRSTDQGDLYYEKPIVLRIDGTPPL